MKQCRFFKKKNKESKHNTKNKQADIYKKQTKKNKYKIINEEK